MWAWNEDLLEVHSHREVLEPSGSSKYWTAFGAIESERARLIAAVRSSMNAVLAQGLGGNTAAQPSELPCTAPAVHTTCRSHHLPFAAPALALDSASSRS